MMRLLSSAAIFVLLAIAATSAQAQSTAPRSDALSLEQKTKISQLITKQTPPLASSSFSIAIDSVVPSEIEIHSLPAAAEQVAPQVRGYGYVVVEEQIALVDPRSRKVEIVFPRWREP